MPVVRLGAPGVRVLALAAAALLAGCGPAIDCGSLDKEACRSAAASAIAAGERHRPGIDIRRVTLGADGAYTIEYADGGGLGVTQ